MKLRRDHVEEMYAHAREAEPEECCGLIGGMNNVVHSVYRLRNVAREPRVGYEAAPEDLFAAQRQIRTRGEQLLAIYHSHPLSGEPEPSETDVRMAYYPSAIYFIIGLQGEEATLRAFRINESERVWDRARYTISDE
jgi:[CysO sulfur-carrier protein]-S-L-cysteine hydrolase